MDQYGMAGGLLDEAYQTPEGIQEHHEELYEALAKFFSSMTGEELWHGAAKIGLPWAYIRSCDEIMDDAHLREWGFYVEVEHPELGRSFTHPGAAAMYNGSPWSISRRAPLVGEHNEEILCGELGLSKAELAVLAESGSCSPLPQQLVPGGRLPLAGRFSSKRAPLAACLRIGKGRWVFNRGER